MNHGKILALASMAVLMLGCKAEIPPNHEATVPVTLQAPAEITAPATLSAAQLLEQKLKKDMPYAELRKIVLASGWLPLKTYACNENVGGEALICTQIPELDACSSDGRCVMWLAEGATMTKLRVDTYGDYRHWNTAGREDEFNVKSWEFSSAIKAEDSKTVACPSNDFEGFLKVFARDKVTQAAFTLPLVKVEELTYSETLGIDSYTVYVNKSDYKDFDLLYKNDGFHVLDGADIVDAMPTALEVKPEDSGSYYIKYLYGMSEGNSYRFKKHNSCWYLSEDPDAPSS